MDGGRVQSEFNSALEYLKRINDFFFLCGEARVSLNGYLWASVLSCLFAELSTKMNPKELNDRLVELKDLVSTTSVSKRFVRSKGFDSSLYWRLYHFELFLRRVFSESGLESKLKADASNILFKGGV